ncbi:MAG: von Willebrand factor type A domain-containing protein [Actinomycetota bacterium]
MRITEHHPSRPSIQSRPSLLLRLLVVFGAVAVLATACGSDDDEAAESGDSASVIEDRSSDTAGGDAEADFSTTDAGSTDDGSDADGFFADADDDMAEEAAADGLFGSSEEEPDPARLEDNTFENHGVRPFVDTDVDATSTFALDVDTGSYVVARRWIDEGVRPPADGVRVEEFVNFFDYDYAAPPEGLRLHVDGGPSPFDDGNVLVRVGVQAAVIDDDERPPAALTFVVDTSGSMDRDDRLGLVKEALRELVDELDDDDTVAIVTYGDSSAIILEPTPAAQERTIVDAIDDLRPGGSTNLEAGLRTGYELADQMFVEGGINRLILASDGVANVGTTDADRLTRDISDRAIDGIQLVTVGFGMGNFNDATMEQLADRGDGFYAYVDTRDEAERLFEDELIATLAPVAIDARIQIQFDEDLVDEYRLIGFENRGILDRDFRNDDVDAGELSSGHTVTALYELDLDRDAGTGDDLGEITLRWRDPGTGNWIETDADIEFDDIESRWLDTSLEFQLATTVATWAEVLRSSPYADDIDLIAVAEEADRLDRDLRTEQSDELADLTDRTVSLS